MGRDIGETKKRLLQAATQEFSCWGIAGARVDRIAEQAACSKALIYDYFGNKDDLFDVVYNTMVVTLMQEVPMDALDLVGYVGQLFDQYLAHPEILRLTAWDLLERDGRGTRLEAVQVEHQHKLAVIEQAQHDGQLPSQWSPAELLTFVTNMSTTWLFAQPDSSKLSMNEVDRQRQIITAAIRLFLNQP
jgi:AcrR family transcriptional regulator